MQCARRSGGAIFIDGFTGSGILDERSMPGKLTVANTVVRHTQQSGIKIAAGGGAGSKTQAVLSNVRVHNSAQAALTVNGGAKAMVSNSVFSGSAFGVDVEQANSEATVSNSTIAGNTTGLFTTGGAVLRLSNSDVILNGTGVNGTVKSYSTTASIPLRAAPSRRSASRAVRPACSKPRIVSARPPHDGGREFLSRARSADACSPTDFMCQVCGAAKYSLKCHQLLALLGRQT